MSGADELKARLAAVTGLVAASKPLDKGGGPPNDSDMEARLTKLETRLDTILPTLATKADISDTRVAIAESKSDIIKWLSGGVLATIAIIVSVMAFMLNRIVPPPSAPQQPPIVIQMPAVSGAATISPATSVTTSQVATKQFDPATARPIEQVPAAKKQ